MQVIKESQRLFPAAAIGPLRYAQSDAELAGYFIPKGTHIQVSRAPACGTSLHMRLTPKGASLHLPVLPRLQDGPC